VTYGGAVAWYLSQNFELDTPGSQVFLAPGPDDLSLDEAALPWAAGRLVRFPGRYWHRLLLAIAVENAAAAEILDRWSGSPDPESSSEQLPSPSDIELVRRPMANVAAALRAGQIISDAELGLLGPHTREGLASMLDAVMIVVDEATAIGQPFDAWPE
jgi:hypothetical protein